MAQLTLSYSNWLRQEHQGLFDYKQQKKCQNILKCKDSGVLYRNKNTFGLAFISNKLLSTLNTVSDVLEPLIMINQNDHQFKITDSKNEKEPLSLIVRDNDGIEFQENNIIKIGRVIVKVLKIQLGNQQKPRKKSADIQINKFKYITEDFYQTSENIPKKQENQQSPKLEHKQIQNASTNDYSTIETNPFCRFCYSRSITEDNKFVMNCKCEGSTKYIHEKCLANWLQVKGKLSSVKKNKQNITTIYEAVSKGFKCEICNFSYSYEDILKILSKKFNGDINFFPIQNMDKYLVLQVQMDEQKMVFIINLQKQPEVTIGRGYQCDMILNQLSVSRFHCVIKFQQNKVKIFDLQSKFGTIIKKPSIVLKDGPAIQLQKGRTVFSAKQTTKKKNIFQSLFLCSSELAQ